MIYLLWFEVIEDEDGKFRPFFTNSYQHQYSKILPNFARSGQKHITDMSFD
jgi:hypothetical protein